MLVGVPAWIPQCQQVSFYVKVMHSKLWIHYHNESHHYEACNVSAVKLCPS